MTSTNAPAITSDTAVANVYDTLTSAFNMWGDAYAATRADVLAGHTVKAISAAWKALDNPGIPTSVAMVGSFVAAASLTDTGMYSDAWLLAFKGKEDENGDLISTYHGEIEPAHRVIERARKISGMEDVGYALSLIVEDEDGTPEFSSVIDSLIMLKALSIKQPKDDDEDGTGEGSEDESEGESEESTPDDRAASVIAVLTALVNGGTPASEPMNMEMARLAKAYFAMCGPAKTAKTA